MKILGIDYGNKRIGLAVSNEDQTMAFPRVVLNNDKSLFENLKEIIETENITKIVIGDSKDFKMKDNPIMKEIYEFKNLIQNKFGIEVVLHPEVLSSHQASKMFGDTNKMIDASAATIILQSYLDFIK